RGGANAQLRDPAVGSAGDSVGKLLYCAAIFHDAEAEGEQGGWSTVGGGAPAAAARRGPDGAGHGQSLSARAGGGTRARGPATPHRGRRDAPPALARAAAQGHTQCA